MPLGIIADQISQDLEVACKVASSKGLKYIDIHNVFNKAIEELNDEEVNTVKKILDKYNLKISNLASTVFFMCKLHEDDEISLFSDTFLVIHGDVDTHLRYLERACIIANVLGAKTVRAFPFVYPDSQKSKNLARDMELIVENFKKAVVIAEKHNIDIVIENCPHSFCPKGEMTYEIVSKVGSKFLKCLWDPGNSYRANVANVDEKYLKLNLLEEFELIKEKIGHMHIKNYQKNPDLPKPFVHIGTFEGDINFEELMFKMSEYNSNITLSLEPEVDDEATLKSIDDSLKMFN